MIKKISLFLIFISFVSASLTFGQDTYFSLHQLKSFNDKVGFYNQAKDAIENNRKHLYLSTEFSRVPHWGKADSLKAFKIFLPPGATHLSFVMYVYRDNKVALVFRFGQPPECSACDKSYLELELNNNYDHTLNSLRQNDLYLTNGGGTIALSLHLGPPGKDDGLSEDEAGWLYVKLLPYSSDYIQLLQVTIDLNVEKFVSWFNSFNAWDNFGDPIWGTSSSNLSNIDCSKDLSLCSNPYTCEVAGGVWCNETCKTKEECPQAESDNSSNTNINNNVDSQTGPSSPSGSNSSAVSSTNNSPSSRICDSYHLEYCDSEYTCEFYDGVWCNNKCYKPEEAPSNCVSSSVYQIENSNSNSSGTQGSSNVLNPICYFIPTDPRCKNNNSNNSNTSNQAINPNTSISSSFDIPLIALDNYENAADCICEGGYWLDNRCYFPKNSVSFPQQAKIFDCDQDLSCYDFGGLVTNEDKIAAGEKLRVALLVPYFKEKIKIILAIKTPDDSWIFLRKNEHIEFLPFTTIPDKLPVFMETKREEQVPIFEIPLEEIPSGKYTLYWIFYPADKDFSLDNVTDTPYILGHKIVEIP